MHLRNLVVICAIGTCLSLPAYAALPTHTVELKARTNSSGNLAGSFNIPEGASINTEPVSVDDGSGVAFSVDVLPGADSGRSGIWFGASGTTGSIVYKTPEGALLSEASLNDVGEIGFSMEGISDFGIHIYDTSSNAASNATTGPTGALSWSGVRINDSGHIGYRANLDQSKALVVWDGTNPVSYATSDGGSDYDFLFVPDFNDAGQLAAKVIHRDMNCNQIRLFTAEDTSKLIAQDQDCDANSEYVDFDNGVAVNAAGEVVFVAELESAARSVIVSDGEDTTTIATEGQGGVAEIDFFDPGLNDEGLVTFRGVDDSGLQTVWLGDGIELEPVLVEHDVVQVDAGTAQIDQHDDSSVFSAEPRINNRGDIAIAASVTPEGDDQTEWGTAILLLVAETGSTGDDAGNGGDDAGGMSDVGQADEDVGGNDGADAGNSTTSDGGNSDDDTGTTSTGGPDAGMMDDMSSEEEGCGCRTPGGPTGKVGGVLPALLILGVCIGIGLRRRRRVS